MSDLKKLWWETSNLKKKGGKTEEKAAKISRDSGPTPVARGWLRG